jgi:nucleoside-diphosphate-sugar epimerase
LLNPFTAYGGHGQPFGPLKELNVAMLRAAAQAVRNVCPAVEAWTLQTGGKAYGVEFFGQPGFTYGPAPLVESMAPVPEPFADKIFYYAQLAALKEIATADEKKWRVVEARPDVIVGFTPHGNAMGLGVALGLFLALYRHIHGDGAKIPFPGNEIVWQSKRSDSSQDVIARFHIHAALNPDTDGKAYNIADEDYVTWAGGLWKDVCAHFGLVGLAPGEGTDDASPKGVEWVMANQPRWGEFVEKNGLRSGFLETATWETMAIVFGYSLFDRQYDLSASRSTGFKDYAPAVKGYLATFDRMKEAKIIP